MGLSAMFGRSFLLAAIAAAVISSPVSVAGQSGAVVHNAPDKVCFVRGGLEQVPGTRSVRIVVDQADEPTFVARGFRKVSCTGFSTSFRRAADHMCQISALKNQQLEDEFMARHGVTPTELCTLSR